MKVLTCSYRPIVDTVAYNKQAKHYKHLANSLQRNKEPKQNVGNLLVIGLAVPLGDLSAKISPRSDKPPSRASYRLRLDSDRKASK